MEGEGDEWRRGGGDDEVDVVMSLMVAMVVGGGSPEAAPKKMDEIKKAKVYSKTKTSTNSDIQDLPSRNQRCQGRLFASFQYDAKYEHVSQDTSSQDGKDDKDKQAKDLKILKLKTKLKDNDKGSRSKITKHEGTSLK
ncbi:hypothetical protein Tco_0212714 [Tanacetum coccineum]